MLHPHYPSNCVYIARESVGRKLGASKEERRVYQVLCGEDTVFILKKKLCMDFSISVSNLHELAWKQLIASFGTVRAMMVQFCTTIRQKVQFSRENFCFFCSIAVKIA